MSLPVFAGQAIEIGSVAINILIDTWEGHLTPTEVASMADKASRGRDAAMKRAAAELALSCLAHAQALNPQETKRALLQCKEAEEGNIMLEKVSNDRVVGVVPFHHFISAVGQIWICLLTPIYYQRRAIPVRYNDVGFAYCRLVWRWRVLPRMAVFLPRSSSTWPGTGLSSTKRVGKINARHRHRPKITSRLAWPPAVLVRTPALSDRPHITDQSVVAVVR